MSGGSGRMLLLSMGSLRVRNRMALGIREILKISLMITCLTISFCEFAEGSATVIFGCDSR